MVARKIYDMYRNDPNQNFNLKEFKQLLNDELKIDDNDFTALMNYMKEKNYIHFYQDGVGMPYYFLIRANLIDFVENLPNG